ncbi:MAG: hypothetical protein H6550_12020 [Chitinophagales bacterium]|nr:hypothetical protein [Chitinophagales bacterium]
MKKIMTLLILGALAIPAFAQNQTNRQEQAQQAAKLVMSNAIEITFGATGTATGNTVSLAFNNVNDYANGVESSAYQVKVRSNKKFRVQAKTSSSRFSYSGTTTPAPLMNVSNILFLKVTNNTTGGSVGSSFNNRYRTMSSSNQTLINNATPGGNNTFDVTYKATPGYNFPAGTYTVNVVYTATQL